MKKYVKFAVMALCLCLLLTGCGGKKTEDAATEPSATSPQPNPDLKVEDCYTYVKNSGGTYSYSVQWRGGGILHSVSETDRPVSFEAASEDILTIYGERGPALMQRWAVFCDIQRGRVSTAFGGYLAARGNYVAFLDNRTEAYHVFVCDPFESNEYVSVTTLEGLVVAEGENVSLTYELDDDGILHVIYTTAEGDKTVAIDLNKTEE